MVWQKYQTRVSETLENKNDTNSAGARFVSFFIYTLWLICALLTL